MTELTVVRFERNCLSDLRFWSFVLALTWIRITEIPLVMSDNCLDLFFLCLKGKLKLIT